MADAAGIDVGGPDMPQQGSVEMQKLREMLLRDLAEQQLGRGASADTGPPMDQLPLMEPTSSRPLNPQEQVEIGTMPMYSDAPQPPAPPPMAPMAPTQPSGPGPGMLAQAMPQLSAQERLQIMRMLQQQYGDAPASAMAPGMAGPPLPPGI